MFGLRHGALEPRFHEVRRRMLRARLLRRARLLCTRVLRADERGRPDPFLHMLRRERQVASSSSIGASVNEEFLTRLRSFVRRRVPSVADADDLVQTVLLRLVKGNKHVSDGAVHRWLYEVARNAIADYYRSPRNGTGLEEAGEVPGAESPESAGLVECIQPLLRTLPVDDRKLLARVDIDGISQAQIAREAGIPRSSVKSRVQRARAKLRNAVLASCVTEWDASGRPMGPARCKSSPSPDCGCG